MTPDEMKVLARVANRNAIENDSPIVVDDSRLIAPINNDSNELPLSLEKLDARLDVLESMQDAGIQKVNELESALGMVNGATDSPVKLLAQSLAQTRADVADLKSVRDVMRLSPADVLSGVIKPTKITSAADLNEADFTNAFATDSEKLNGEIVTGKTKVIRSLKDLGTRPKNLLSLDNIGVSANILTKISGDAELITGGVELSSNSGLKIIDLSNKDFDLNSDIKKINATAISTTSVKTIDGTIDRFDFSAASNVLKGSKTIALKATGNYNGMYESTASMPTSAPSVGSHYIFVLDEDDYNYYLYKWVSTAYVIINTSHLKEFTDGDISAGVSVDVLFAGTSTYMGLKYKPATANTLEGYIYVDPTPLNGSNILVEDRSQAAVGSPAVRPLYIVRSTPIDQSIVGVTTQQSATLIKPTSEQYYKLQGFDKYVRLAVSTGEVSSSLGATFYFNDNNILYTQGTAASANRVRLNNDTWLFNSITRKFSCNSDTVQGPVPAGYYNYGTTSKLVKMDGQGNVIFDSLKGEVIAYRFKNNKFYKLTVPSITNLSLVAAFFPSLSSVSSLTDLYVSEDLFIRNETGNPITTLEGLYYVKGDTAFPRANLLYRINATGKCNVYSGLAYLEIEPENAYGLRVWYIATAGVLAPLSTNYYLNTSNNRVFSVGVTGTGQDYTTEFFAAIHSYSAKTRNEILANPIRLSDLTTPRFTVTMINNIRQYQALGFISGKTTMADVAALGGLEIVSSVATSFNGIYMKVVSGTNYEIVYVSQSNTIATATRNNSVLSGNLLFKIGTELYNIDNSRDNLLVKATSGYVFNDESDTTDLKQINSEGVIETLSSDCVHFAWAGADGVSKVFWVDTNNGNRVQRIAGNFGYDYSARSGPTNYTNIVFLIMKPINSTNIVDEEDSSNETSSYTMHILDIATGTYSPLPVPDTNNNGSKGYTFLAANFNATEFPSSNATGAITYWHRDASNNKPHINRIVRMTNGIKYNTDSLGIRKTSPLAISGEYSTDSSNVLYWGNTSSVWVKNVADVQSKYYIDYDGNLAQSGPTYGDRALITTGNYFVVFANNDYRSRYYSNGRMVVVTPGTLVAVSSSAAAQSANHKHNGLKMWGKDATGMYNRWLDFQVDVNRQSNNASVSDVVDIYTIDAGTQAVRETNATIVAKGLGMETSVNHTSISETARLAVPEMTVALELTDAVLIGGSGNTAGKPSTNAANDGKYYHDIQANILYFGAAGTGAMGAATGATTLFISGDGKLYSAATANGATTPANGGNVVKVDGKLYNVSSTGVLTATTTGHIIKADSKLYSVGAAGVLTAVTSGKIITGNYLKSAGGAGALTVVQGNVGDRIQLSSGATNYMKLNNASSGAVVDLAINDYVFDVSALRLYKATAAGTSAPLVSGAIKALYNNTALTGAFAISGSKLYSVTASGVASTTALAINDAIWVDNSIIATIKAVAAADTTLVTGTHFHTAGSVFKVSNDQTFLLTLADAFYANNACGIIQKDGTLLRLDSGYMNGNVVGGIQLLIIDGMVQDARAPRGTQIQVLAASDASIKTYTRLGYSKAQKAANDLIAGANVRDQWISN